MCLSFEFLLISSLLFCMFVFCVVVFGMFAAVVCVCVFSCRGATPHLII